MILSNRGLDQKDPLVKGFLRLRKKWMRDPVRFVRHVFQFHPGEEITWQQEIVLLEVCKPGAHVSIRSGHGTGKSTSFAWAIFWDLCVYDEIKVPVTAPTAAQLEDVLWSELRKWHGRMLPWLRDQFVITASAVEVKSYMRPGAPPHWASARTARKESSDSLQGIHSKQVHYLVDEAYGVEDSVFKPIEGAMTTSGTRATLAGNPTANSGYMFETQHRNRGSWTRICLDAEKSPLVSKKSIENYEKRYGRDSDDFRIRVQGRHARQAQGQLISREVAEAAARRFYKPEMFQSAPSILGVDCSGFGGDKTVIFHRKGLFSEELLCTRQISDVSLAGRIHEEARRLNAKAIFIDTGYGQGTIAILRDLGLNPIGVNFGATGLRPREFRDRKAECWWGMREWLKEGGWIPNDPDLIEDLIAPRKDFTLKGLKFIESKKDMKKRGLASGDKSDALSLTFAAPVSHANIDHISLQRGTLPPGRMAIGYEKMTEFDFD